MNTEKCSLARFEVQNYSFYGDGILGRAVVYAVYSGCHATKIDFIYHVDENDKWTFIYEKGTCLSEEEKAIMEKRFISWAKIMLQKNGIQ